MQHRTIGPDRPPAPRRPARRSAPRYTALMASTSTAIRRLVHQPLLPPLLPPPRLPLPPAPPPPALATAHTRPRQPPVPARHHPSVSPDGRRIAFISNREGATDLYVIGVDGSAPVRLTQSPEEESLPGWSAAGDRVWFSVTQG